MICVCVFFSHLHMLGGGLHEIPHFLIPRKRGTAIMSNDCNINFTFPLIYLSEKPKKNLIHNVIQQNGLKKHTIKQKSSLFKSEFKNKSSFK